MGVVPGHQRTYTHLLCAHTHVEPFDAGLVASQVRTASFLFVTRSHTTLPPPSNPPQGIRMFAQSARKKGIDIHLQVAENVPATLLLDGVRLQQVRVASLCLSPVFVCVLITILCFRHCVAQFGDLGRAECGFLTRLCARPHRDTRPQRPTRTRDRENGAGGEGRREGKDVSVNMPNHIVVH